MTLLHPLSMTLATAVLLVGTTALAQTGAPAPPEPAQPGARVERITHEDGLARIDELRVGGETRSIDVQPKNGAPAYQINPINAGGGPNKAGERSGNAGKSSWRVLNF